MHLLNLYLVLFYYELLYKLSRIVTAMCLIFRQKKKLHVL